MKPQPIKKEIDYKKIVIETMKMLEARKDGFLQSEAFASNIQDWHNAEVKHLLAVGTTYALDFMQNMLEEEKR